MNKVSAQIENRKFEQIINNQIQDVNNAPGASIAIIKRVNAFELVVNDGKFLSMGRDRSDHHH